MSSATKSVLGDILLSNVTTKITTYNRQTTPHISYIHINTQGYNIKTPTLHKQTSQNKHMQNSPATRCHRWRLPTAVWLP